MYRRRVRSECDALVIYVVLAEQFMAVAWPQLACCELYVGICLHACAVVQCATAYVSNVLTLDLNKCHDRSESMLL